MQRNKEKYSLAGRDVKDIKERMLNWASRFSILLFLDNNEYSSKYDGYECLLACGIADSMDSQPCISLEALQQLHGDQNDWLFGHICYDYKNTIEPKLQSRHDAVLDFPLLYFFIPQTVCYINRECTELTIETFEKPEDIYAAIFASATIEEKELPRLEFTTLIDKRTYLETIDKLRTHIADGDCYEINFCNKGYCENAVLDPIQIFKALTCLSPAPFSAFYKLQERYMMCASPERYIRKEGAKVLCQPIKGTARRDKDPAIDERLKQNLNASIKERAENVMIVDLVRNDLARCCETGSVQVDELFGVYSFPQVHQMISTVSGTLGSSAPFTDALKYSFPMGSMTGAPKFKVMQLIDQYEQTGRELFSGTVGYITPGGDFDFNVIIRSLFYNANTKYLSYQTGGAITYDSYPEKEWEEIRLKAWALERIFS